MLSLDEIIYVSNIINRERSREWEKQKSTKRIELFVSCKNAASLVANISSASWQLKGELLKTLSTCRRMQKNTTNLFCGAFFIAAVSDDDVGALASETRHDPLETAFFTCWFNHYSLNHYHDFWQEIFNSKLANSSVASFPLQKYTNSTHTNLHHWSIPHSLHTQEETKT